MQKGIIGKKLGMTQLFDENGKVVPVTVIEAGPCTVVQKKTVESDGYEAVQLGFGEVSAKKVNKAAKGHFDKADVAPKRTLREFRLDDISGMNVGDILKADVFTAGDKVDVIGTSKGESDNCAKPVDYANAYAVPSGTDCAPLWKISSGNPLNAKNWTGSTTRTPPCWKTSPSNAASGWIALSRSTAGAMMLPSSSPKAPCSPAWGFKSLHPH